MLGKWDYELNGVKYRAATVDEKYRYSGEPLRPANAQLIQGQGNLFNLRPDLLRWRIDDWSGGQGQYTFDGSQETNSRYWKGFYVDGFSKYGLIGPGAGATLTTSPVDSHHLVVFRDSLTGQDSLYAIETFTPGTNFIWNGASWATTPMFDSSLYVKDSLAADDEYVYYYEGSSGKLYKDDGVSVTEIGNSGPTVTTNINSQLVAFRNFLLLVTFGPGASESGVWQLSKNVASTTAMTQIYDLTGSNHRFVVRAVAVGPNRIFVATDGDDGRSTYVHEIIPDDASQTGYGYIRATVPGVYADTMWYSGGLLWLAGRTNSASQDTNDERGIQLYYLDLGQGTYGSVSSYFREADDEVQAVKHSFGGAVEGSLSHVVTMAQVSANVEHAYLWQIDQSTGGVQQYGRAIGDDTASGLNVPAQYWVEPLLYQDEVFFSVGSNNWGGVIRWSPDLIPDGAYFITSWYEFGLADPKSLSSVEMNFRRYFSSDWDVKVYYQADDDTGEDITGWTLLGTATGDGATSNFSIAAATSSVQRTFNRVRFAVLFDDTSISGATDRPELTSITFTAQVATKFKVREIWVSLLDEQGANGRKGHLLIDNIKTVGDLGTVVDFKDGYQNRDPSDYEQTDVLVDAYRIYLDAPGEGVAWLRLLESY